MKMRTIATMLALVAILAITNSAFVSAYHNPSSYTDVNGDWSIESGGYASGGNYARSADNGGPAILKYKAFGYSVGKDLDVTDIDVYVKWRDYNSYDNDLDNIMVKIYIWDAWAPDRQLVKTVYFYSSGEGSTWEDDSTTKSWTDPNSPNGMSVSGLNLTVSIEQQQSGLMFDIIHIDWVHVSIAFAG